MFSTVVVPFIYFTYIMYVFLLKEKITVKAIGRKEEILFKKKSPRKQFTRCVCMCHLQYLMILDNIAGCEARTDCRPC